MPIRVHISSSNGIINLNGQIPLFVPAILAERGKQIIWYNIFGGAVIFSLPPALYRSDQCANRCTVTVSCVKKECYKIDTDFCGELDDEGDNDELSQLLCRICFTAVANITFTDAFPPGAQKWLCRCA